MFDSLQALRSRRSTVFALLLAATAQVSLVSHEVLVEHSTGEHCEICIAQDRFQTLSITTDTYVGPLLTGFDIRWISRPVSAEDSDTVRNRGPPLL